MTQVKPTPRFLCLLPTAYCLLLCSCASQQDANVKTLRAGYDALAAHRLDDAVTAADKVLANSPTKTLPAEAHYLKGSAYEDRAMSSPTNLSSDLQRARTEYIAAIAEPHAPDLEGRARAGVANVAFHQDDYATAYMQWQSAYEKLERPEDKYRTLYRLGQTAQRIGHWEEADKFFTMIEQSAPNTDLATKARQHRGARGFIVQLATFADAKQAVAAVTALRRQGIAAQDTPDPANPSLHLIRISPLSTWLEAKALRQRFAAEYPNIVILP